MGSVKLERPLLLGVGAQKSGTTWLANTLQDRTNVKVPGLKELHYFDALSKVPKIRRAAHQRHYKKFLELVSDQDALRKAGRRKVEILLDRSRMTSDAEYVAFLQRYGRGGPVADITPEYATLDVDGFTHIRTLAPQTVPVFIMRDPVERVWSAAKHRHRRSGNGKALESLDALLRFAQATPVAAMTDYAATAQALQQVFETSHLVFYEEIFASRSAAQGMLQAILRSIGEPEEIETTDLLRPVYASQKRPLPDHWRGPLREALDWTYVQVAEAGIRPPPSWTTA